MHALGNLAWFGLACVGGAMEPELEDERWGYGSPRPRSAEAFPSADHLRDLVGRVRAATLDNMAGVTDAQVSGPPSRPNQSKATQADCCIRAIWHMAAHVRQIWALRGALGLVDQTRWPRQHWS